MKKLLLVLLLLSSLIFISCSETTGDDIINPNSDFLYFYGKTCPHCQELNKELEALDMYSLVSIEKRETYFNNDNRLLFLAATEELGIDPSRVGVPFVLDRRTREYAIGVQPAIALLSTRIGQDNGDITIPDLQGPSTDLEDDEVIISQ
ncbi:hypothetical protein LAT59_01955 [Candidatus Gracilibacteria bacterium]|nr:hypothetical protein [Candidatus Gracilibacteria bacterium]